MPKRTGVLKEFYLFLRENKVYWIAPIIIAILLLAGIAILGTIGGGAAAPFIYTLF